MLFTMNTMTPHRFLVPGIHQRLFRQGLVLALLLPAFSRPGLAQNPAPFELRDGDRVALVGDTLIEREQSFGYVEFVLTTHYPDRNVTFRNLGWSADTPLGASRAGFDTPDKGYDRLKEQLALVKPTVAIVGYGMAASFNGEAGVAEFKEQLQKLTETVRQSGGPDVRFIYLSPIAHEPLPPPAPNPDSHNAQLALYADAVRHVAEKENAHFVNLFKAFSRTNLPFGTPRFTDNGIHLNDYGYRLMSEFVASALNWESHVWRLGILANGGVRDGSWGVKLLSQDLKPKETRLEILTEQLVFPPPLQTGQPQPSFAGRNRLQIVSMTEGHYDVFVDDAFLMDADQATLRTSIAIDKGPQFDQAEALRQVILKKNELFFHRYRPENNTYLFLFRKHEQGQNAKEIPQFDPLIEENEKKIAELRKPRKHVVQIVPSKVRPAPTPVVAERPEPARDKTPLPHPQFDTDENIEISLYAENPLLAKPIHMNFDPQGRLWVASSEVYPQIKPGQPATDKVLLLEDTDGDGRAEKSTVYAGGLLIPTGVEPGDGGVYVGQSTELLHFKDVDGDGRADQRRVVLSGFGTEDTHHILHTLRWGPDGPLYMNQSIYIHTHTETPHGVTRLNSGGILGYRPGTMELGILMKGLVNSWGHAFDRYGQSFATDGASSADAWRGGLNWVIPQAMFFTYERSRRILDSISPGSYPKFCGLEYVRSTHFPDDWQGNFVTCDFRAHRVVRFAVDEKDSAYVTRELPDIARTKDVAFRPIDIKVGPDGALYIADWSNPIIQHGEVDFRDSRRDHEHGRIWRIAYKGRSLVPKENLTRKAHAAVLDELLSPNDFIVRQARRVLLERDPKIILPQLKSWTEKQTSDEARLQALWMYQGLDEVNTPLLEGLLKSQSAQIRAAAVRALALWQERQPGREGGSSSPEIIARAASGWPTAPLPLAHRKEIPTSHALALLGQAIADRHPRVVVEALRGLARIPTAKAAELALTAAERTLDKYAEYALWLTINDLARPWLAAVKSGDWKPEGREKQLEFALKSIEPASASEILGQLLGQIPLPRDGSGAWIELIGQAGTAKELRALFNQALTGGFDDKATAKALGALNQATRVRNVRPSGDLSPAATFLQSPTEGVKVAAVRLLGAWKIGDSNLVPIVQLAGGENTPSALRDAAFGTLRDLGGKTVADALVSLTGEKTPLPIRRQALTTLASVDFALAVTPAVDVLVNTPDENESLALWRALLNIKRSAPALARALPKTGIPQSVAKAGLRAAREGGRSEPELVLALTRGSGLEEGEVTLTETEFKQLAVDVAKKGDPARGEQVYRRKELSCVPCHAIGGSGGRVGPDLTSIGASAPVDYLIESVWFPNKKIKEGYHAVTVATKDGEEYAGVLVRESGQELVLRDATAKEITITKNNIADRRVGILSLMPAGLIDGISADDRIDLFRFLSELGKPGSFDATKGNVARTWRLRPGIHTVEQFGEDKFVAAPLTDPAWTVFYSQVDGKVTPEIVRDVVTVGKYLGLTGLYVATRLQVAQDGQVTLQLNGKAEAGWMDGKALKLAPTMPVDLAAGNHTIVFRLDPKKLPETLRLESSGGTFLTE
jgi:putative heme-binding domain-containing protein